MDEIEKVEYLLGILVKQVHSMLGVERLRPSTFNKEMKDALKGMNQGAYNIQASCMEYRDGLEQWREKQKEGKIEK